MLRLVYSTAPQWHDLIGDVRVLCRPFTAGLQAAAAAEARRDLRDGAGEDERYVALTSAVAGVAILEWEGVGGEDGSPAPVTPEAIKALMDIYVINQRFAEVYLTPGLLMGVEKKGLSSGLGGISGAGLNIVAPAQVDALTAGTS